MGREETPAETALEKDAGSKLGMRGATVARYASEAPVASLHNGTGSDGLPPLGA